MPKEKLKNFLDESGRLKSFPAKRKMKLYALLYLSGKIDSGRAYTEREIGELLGEWHLFDDPATLRRELCDYGFLLRSRDGRTYSMNEEQPTEERLGL